MELYTSSGETPRHRVECHVVRHSGTGVGGTCLELDTCVLNGVNTDMYSFDAAKVDMWP